MFNFAGLYKVSIPPPPGGKLMKSVGEEYQVVKRGKKYNDCGEKYNLEIKGKWKQYHLPNNIEAVGKNTE